VEGFVLFFSFSLQFLSFGELIVHDLLKLGKVFGQVCEVTLKHATLLLGNQSKPILLDFFGLLLFESLVNLGLHEVLLHSISIGWSGVELRLLNHWFSGPLGFWQNLLLGAAVLSFLKPLLGFNELLFGLEQVMFGRHFLRV